MPSLKRKALLFGLTAVCLLLWACGDRRGGPVIAKVNGAKLTLEDLHAEIPEYYQNSVTFEQKLQFVDRWIDSEVLYQEALRRGLQRDALLREKIRAAEKTILIAELVQRELEDRVRVTEEEASEYYQAHLDDFTRKADEVRASQILVPTLEEARKIRREIEGGGDFAQLALKHSVDPSAEQGGDLGYFAGQDVLQEIAKSAFSLAPGSLSQPIKTEFGYHLISVTDIKKKGTVRSFDLVRDEINDRFYAVKELEELELFLEELRENSSIKKNLELLQTTSSAQESSSVPLDGGDADSSL